MLQVWGISFSVEEQFYKHHVVQNFMMRMKDKKGATYLVTTEKDWMRMASFASALPDIAYLCIRFAVTSGQAKFFKMIKKGIEKSA